jgi:hypothetical protein
MADIDVVKKGSRTWLWVLLVIAILMIVWFMMGATGTPTTGRVIAPLSQPAESVRVVSS